MKRIHVPLTPVDRQALEHLEQALELIRRRLGVGDRGETLDVMHLDEDELMEIKADGYGGATLTWYEPHGDDEVLVHGSHVFETEEAACAALRWFRDQWARNTIRCSIFFQTLKTTMLLDKPPKDMPASQPGSPTGSRRSGRAVSDK